MTNTTSRETSATTTVLPGQELDLSKMPGHWFLARMGKRVLRPGGIELTRRMLDALAISRSDTVVELAPGLGATARITLSQRPAAYIAVERDAAASARVESLLSDPRDHCVHGNAAETGLESDSADVVYGEAMLTMQTDSQKQKIVAEAFRVLRAGGRYGIHELGLIPDSIPETVKASILRDLSSSIHVGARPLTISEWKETLTSAGFQIDEDSCVTTPMHLLEPRRMISDEGLFGAIRIAWNVIRSRPARQRIAKMRRVFRKYDQHLCAISMVGRKLPVDPERNREAATLPS